MSHNENNNNQLADFKPDTKKEKLLLAELKKAHKEIKQLNEQIKFLTRLNNFYLSRPIQNFDVLNELV